MNAGTNVNVVAESDFTGIDEYATRSDNQPVSRKDVSAVLDVNGPVYLRIIPDSPEKQHEQPEMLHVFSRRTLGELASMSIRPFTQHLQFGIGREIWFSRLERFERREVNYSIFVWNGHGLA